MVLKIWHYGWFGFTKIKTKPTIDFAARLGVFKT